MPTRKATPADVPAMQELINGYAAEGIMLPTSLSELYERLRDYFVATDREELVGVAGLHVTWRDLAEIRSLAVKKEYRGRGLGQRLVRCCLAEARALGLSRVFVLTYIPRFFRRFGFQRVSKNALPHKIWADCLRCQHFPDCKEVPLLFVLKD